MEIQDVQGTAFMIPPIHELMEFTPTEDLHLKSSSVSWMQNNIGLCASSMWQYCNGSGDWTITTVLNFIDRGHHDSLTHVIFIRDPKLAMLFKLTWMGR